ncbi:MAG: hypothetical protein OEY94_09750 [Alphaproteobacteria bacterium]|nr:hypothetical protein [Alphaproteobacteria bacterium]
MIDEVKTVREGIEDYLKTPEAKSFHKKEGSDLVANLLQTNEDFAKAVIKGSKKIDSTFGYPTEEGIKGILASIDNLAHEHGDSYVGLYNAYQSDTKVVLNAIEDNNMNKLAAAFDKGALEGGVLLVAGKSSVTGAMPDLNGTKMINANNGSPVLVGNDAPIPARESPSQKPVASL